MGDLVRWRVTYLILLRSNPVSNIRFDTSRMIYRIPPGGFRREVHVGGAFPRVGLDWGLPLPVWVLDIFGQGQQDSASNEFGKVLHEMSESSSNRQIQEKKNWILRIMVSGVHLSVPKEVVHRLQKTKSCRTTRGRKRMETEELRHLYADDSEKAGKGQTIAVQS